VRIRRRVRRMSTRSWERKAKRRREGRMRRKKTWLEGREGK
jgi:hypothetical protein